MRLQAHELWLSPEGEVNVLVSGHAPADAPSSVAVRVIRIASGGAVLGSVALQLGLEVANHESMEMRAALEECGALRVWDSPSQTLWTLQL